MGFGPALQRPRRPPSRVLADTVRIYCVEVVAIQRRPSTRRRAPVDHDGALGHGRATRLTDMTHVAHHEQPGRLVSSRNDSARPASCSVAARRPAVRTTSVRVRRQADRCDGTAPMSTTPPATRSVRRSRWRSQVSRRPFATLPMSWSGRATTLCAPIALVAVDVSAAAHAHHQRPRSTCRARSTTCRPSYSHQVHILAWRRGLQGRRSVEPGAGQRVDYQDAQPSVASAVARPPRPPASSPAPSAATRSPFLGATTSHVIKSSGEGRADRLLIAPASQLSTRSTRTR